MSGLSALFPVQIDFGISGFRVRDNGIGQHYDALAVFLFSPFSFVHFRFIFCFYLFYLFKMHVGGTI